MSRPDQLEEQRQEIDRLKIVERKIQQQLSRVENILGERKLDQEELRRNFWDNVTVNLTDDTERIETFTSIQQEARVLAERERNVKEAERQLVTLTRLADSPYFGRVDFRADGDESADSVYIGLASLLDEDGETFLIYDWRAPVSSLFYDHSPGRAGYETPVGYISGEMTLKRQFVIKQGKLQHMFDTDVTIGDSMLQEVLSQSSSTQMRNIVATIQREQNRIIRDEKHRLLIVQGAAGSGKTSAALQRVAYLLYRYRGSLTADQIVLFSPNPLFNSYISHVLPELGETNMRQSTFQEYLQRRLRMFRLEVEDLYGQTEFVLAERGSEQHDARIKAIRYKASPEFFAVINRYAARLEKEGLRFRDIRFRGRVLVSGEELAELFYGEELSRYKLHERIGYWKKRVQAILEEREQEERKKRWVSAAIDLLDEEAYRTVYEKLREAGSFKGDTFDDSRKEQAMLRKMVVHEQFVPLYKRLKRAMYIDYLATYRRLLQDEELMRELSGGVLPVGWNRFDELFAAAVEQGTLPYEDATPLLYLKESIDGFSDNDNSVRHVLVDEAQDYSPFQYAVLRRLFPRARMTVLGDLNQAIYMQTAEMNGFAELSALFGVREEEVATIKLLRSYRSTKQIIECSKRLLPSAAEVEPFSREGEEPVWIETDGGQDAAEQAARWLSKVRAAGRRNVGILTYTAKEARAVHELLEAQQLDAHLVTKESGQLEDGISIIPAYLAKGIEFDAVLIWDASQYGESDRKLLYTAFTRAMHHLGVMVRRGQPGLLESVIGGGDPVDIG
jgi:DNA helicase-2/ATP-dependent DNA helicase PcrA